MPLSPLLGSINPTSPIDYANQAAQIQQQQALYPLQQQQAALQVQSAQDELSNKRRSMALSMINGIASEQDPAKQAALYQTLKPMAERYDPTLKLPDEYDPSLSKALMQGQVPASEQYKANTDLQKAAILAGARNKKLVKDPITGEPRILDMSTGELSAASPQDVMATSAADNAGASTRPGFGFDLGQMNPQTFKKQSEVDAARLKSYTTNRQTAENALRILDTLEPNLANFKTGSGGDLRLMGDKAAAMFLPGSMGQSFDATATAGNNIDKSTNDLVTELQKFQYAPGQRGSVLGLKTMLASKPGVGQQEDTNRNIINGLRAKLTDYLTTESIAQAYRDASPLQVINENHVNQVDDALKSIYPLETVDKKTGQVTFHPESVERIQQAIPDAIANPQKYFDQAKKLKPASTARDQAQSLLKQPQQPKGETHDELPDPAKYAGKIATDQTTGEKFVSDGKQWVKQ